MDFNDQEESDKQNDDVSGVGRLYECVFCKRGFNTAQALGGHMNIHRRDKAKNKPTPSTNYYANKQLEEEQNHHHRHRLSRRFYCHLNQPAASYDHHRQLVHDHHQPTSSSYVISRFPDHQRQIIENPNLIVDEGWNMMHPSLDCNSTILGDLEKNREKEELDLELRLGL